MEVMGMFTDHLAATIHDEFGVDPAEAQIAANLLMSVHWQFFRNAREYSLAGRSGPAAARRLRADLDRAYRLLEHGLGTLEPASSAG
jgi:Flp pilus assembly protein TadD